MKFQWIGGPTFLLELGGFRVLSDPVFGEGESAFVFSRHPATGEENAAVARLTGLPPLELEGLDAAIVSQLREDHFDAAAAERIDKDVPVIGPADRARAFSASGFTRVEGLGWWEETERTKAGETLSVTAVPTMFSNDRRMRREYGTANGYVIRHTVGDEKYTVYWTGDTLWFTGARDIHERIERTDLLVPHLGAVGANGPYGATTLSGKQAMQFVFLLLPKTIIPVAYNTFSHYEEGIDDFKARIETTMYDRRLVVLHEGEIFERSA